jgi:hypothetical protein
MAQRHEMTDPHIYISGWKAISEDISHKTTLEFIKLAEKTNNYHKQLFRAYKVA